MCTLFGCRGHNTYSRYGPCHDSEALHCCMGSGCVHVGHDAVWPRGSRPGGCSQSSRCLRIVLQPTAPRNGRPLSSTCQTACHIGLLRAVCVLSVLHTLDHSSFFFALFAVEVAFLFLLSFSSFSSSFSSSSLSSSSSSSQLANHFNHLTPDLDQLYTYTYT